LSLASEPRESILPVDGASLFCRTVGSGPPIVVLHGIPFAHPYLLPEMDRLSDRFRLLYYDQQGRGRSAKQVRPEDVSLASDVAVLDAVRRHFRLNSTVFVGHSWGAQLALAYALDQPHRVSQLILICPAPVSAHDWSLLGKELVTKLGADAVRLDELEASPAHRAGDLDAEISLAQLFFRPAVARPESLEPLMERLRSSLPADGPLQARAVAAHLFAETMSKPGYDLRPALRALRIRTLVIAGDHDIVPSAAVKHIANAIPDASSVALEGCGHFPYLGAPPIVNDLVAAALTEKRTPVP